MEIRHGNLALDVPGHWQDQSTLLFVAPRTAERLTTLSNVEQPTEAVSVTFVVDDDEPQAILARQAEALRLVDPHFEILGEAPFASGLGDGWSYRQRVDLNGSMVQQLAVACRVGRIIVLATAAAVEARFERCADELRGVLASLRIAEK